MAGMHYYSSSRRRKKSNAPRNIIIALLLMILILLIIMIVNSCSNPAAGPDVTPTPGGAPSAPSNSDAIDPTDDPSPSPDLPSGKRTVVLRAVGDLMISKPQLASAKQEDGSYRFDEVFEQIAPYLQGADLTIGNFETTCAGEEDGGYTGYPLFNAPVDFLKALKSAGLDVLTTANNHMLDRKGPGLIKTIENIQSEGFYQTGTSKSQEESEQILIVDVNDVKIAILAYTDLVNEKQTVSQEELSWMINSMDAERIKSDVKKARQQGAHVVILSLHWGEEYVRNAGDSQRRLAQELLESGADIILGSHPHVLQEFTRKSVTVDGEEKEIFVAYSLSNFISEFRDRYSDVGVILELKLEVDLDTGKYQLGESSYLPTWVNCFERDGLKHYRMMSAGQAMDNPDLIVPSSQAASNRVKQAWEETLEHLGDTAAKPVKQFANDDE